MLDVSFSSFYKTTNKNDMSFIAPLPLSLSLSHLLLLFISNFFFCSPTFSYHWHTYSSKQMIECASSSFSLLFQCSFYIVYAYLDFSFVKAFVPIINNNTTNDKTFILNFFSNISEWKSIEYLKFSIHFNLLNRIVYGLFKKESIRSLLRSKESVSEMF